MNAPGKEKEMPEFIITPIYEKKLMNLTRLKIFLKLECVAFLGDYYDFIGTFSKGPFNPKEDLLGSIFAHLGCNPCKKQMI